VHGGQHLLDWAQRKVYRLLPTTLFPFLLHPTAAMQLFLLQLNRNPLQPKSPSMLLEKRFVH
jgi:hypothetical protein